MDEESFDDPARASLLRSRGFIQTPVYRGFSARFEVDDVHSIGADDYNSTENGQSQFPVVADPEGAAVNEAWLRFASGDTNAKLGRQRIRLGTQRFIGTKPWRNNEQTYDGLRLVGSPLEGLTLDASYVYNISRIFGPDDGSNPADWRGDSVFLHSDYRLDKRHAVSAFAYRLDVDRDSAYAAAKTVNNSSDTFGLEYRGSFDRLKARASWALQSDGGESELSYTADYYLVELTAALDRFTLKGAFEVLGGDTEAGFATPLAAAHGVQGWADKFLSTPADGVEDLWVSIEHKVGPVRLIAAYHDFRAEASSEAYGTEIDLLANWQVSRSLRFEAKFAAFDSESKERFDDTTKAWLTVQFML